MKKVSVEKDVESLREKYLKKGPYKIDGLCDRGLFSPEEIEIIEKYGYWFEALLSGQFPLLTERQKKFVKAQQKGFEPKSYYERLWYRYMAATEPPF